MIYKNMLLHNVSELENDGDGGIICRLSRRESDKLNSLAKCVNHMATGVEIRFVMLSDSVTLTLSKPKMLDSDRQAAARGDIYFGNVPCGYTDAEFTYRTDKTQITIHRQSDINREDIARVSKMYNHPFSPEVVRLIFPSKVLKIFDVKGDIRPPLPEEMPKDYCIFYGSSITNGSLALKTPDTFAFRIAEKFGMDYYNLGSSGSAWCEIVIAEHIANMSKDGLRFINLEMGANMYGFSADVYKSRVKKFVEIIAKAHSDIPIICTDLFYCRDDMRNVGVSNTRTEIMRKKLKEALDELRLANTYYVNGKELLTNARGLSGDFAHPNIHGITEIYENLSAFIEKHIK